MMINSLILISNENIKFELFNILIVKEKINFRFLSNGLIIKESEGENIKKVQIFSQTRYDINKMADLLEKYDKTCMSSIYKLKSFDSKIIEFKENKTIKLSTDKIKVLEENSNLVTIKNCTFSFKMNGSEKDNELVNFFFYVYNLDNLH